MSDNCDKHGMMKLNNEKLQRNSPLWIHNGTKKVRRSIVRIGKFSLMVSSYAFPTRMSSSLVDDGF